MGGRRQAEKKEEEKTRNKLVAQKKRGRPASLTSLFVVFASSPRSAKDFSVRPAAGHPGAQETRSSIPRHLEQGFDPFVEGHGDSR